MNEHAEGTATGSPLIPRLEAAQRILEAIWSCLDFTQRARLMSEGCGLDPIIGAVREAAAQLTTPAQARDEYRTLAKIGTWHNDCRPNRHQAAREIEKSQAVINKLADRISELEAQVAQAQEREPTTPDAVAAFIRDVRDEALRLHRTYKHLSSAALIQEAFDRRAGEHFGYRSRAAAPDVPPLAAPGSGPTPDAGGT